MRESVKLDVNERVLGRASKNDRAFKGEMERYLRQYTKGRELAEQMRGEDKAKGFDLEE